MIIVRIGITIVLFMFLLITTLMMKPSFLYDKDTKKYRTFGIRKGETFFSFEIILIVYAFLSYFIIYFLFNLLNYNRTFPQVMNKIMMGGSTNTSQPFQSSQSNQPYLPHQSYQPHQTYQTYQTQPQSYQSYQLNPYQTYPTPFTAPLNNYKFASSLHDNIVQQQPQQPLSTCLPFNFQNFQSSNPDNTTPTASASWSNSLFPGFD